MFAVNRRFFLLACCLLAALLATACFQKFQRLEVKATGEGIIFSHPAMEKAARDGNLCVFGEISVSRENPASEQMWFVQNTASGFQASTEPMRKPYIVYGENLPQTKTIIAPKTLSEGKYRVNGVVGIYNEKRELLNDLSFNDEFVLKNDATGKLTVAPVEK